MGRCQKRSEALLQPERPALCRLGAGVPAVGTDGRMAPFEATPSEYLQLELERASDHGCPGCGQARRELTEGPTQAEWLQLWSTPRNHT